MRPWLASGSPDSVPAEPGAVKVVDARHGRPVVDFVLAADPPAEVHTPAPIVAAFEAQRLERNAQLGRPPAASRLVATVQTASQLRVDVAPFVRDLRIGLCARGVDDEYETIPAIRKGVEDHLEAVLIAGGEVLADVVNDQARRVGVVADDADIECVIVVHNAHFRRLACGGPLMRLRLDKIGRRLGDAPDFFLERRRPG